MNYKILIVDDEQLERRALESIIVLQLGTRVEIMQAVMVGMPCRWHGNLGRI